MSGWSGKNYIIKTILFFPNILITRIQTHHKINSKFGSNILKLICWIIWDCSFKTKSNSSLCVYTLQKKTFCHCIRTFFVTLLQRMVKQGCALLKIEGSPVLWTCKIQGAQHMICMKNLRFSSRPRAKVRRQEPPGSARAQPWWRNAAEGLIHVHFCHGQNKHLSHSFTRHKIQHLLCIIAHNHSHIDILVLAAYRMFVTWT